MTVCYIAFFNCIYTYYIICVTASNGTHTYVPNICQKNSCKRMTLWQRRHYPIPRRPSWQLLAVATHWLIWSFYLHGIVHMFGVKSTCSLKLCSFFAIDAQTVDTLAGFHSWGLNQNWGLNPVQTRSAQDFWHLLTVFSIVYVGWRPTFPLSPSCVVVLSVGQLTAVSRLLVSLRWCVWP